MLAKYITVNSPLGPMAIIAPAVIEHFQAVNPEALTPLSAGFFSIANGRVRTEGASTSLQLGPLPDDAAVITTTLVLSGLLPA